MIPFQTPLTGATKYRQLAYSVVLQSELRSRVKEEEVDDLGPYGLCGRKATVKKKSKK